MKLFNLKWKLVHFKELYCAIAFLIIVIYIFTHYSYLMRNRDGESSHITGITQVKDVDVVFIGSSVIETAWQPYRAWQEYGITSYDFATSGGVVGSEKGLMQYINRYQSPKLYVIDVRGYIKDTGEGVCVGKTNMLNYSWERLKTVFFNNELCDNKNSLIDLYFDILTYQGNADQLGKEEAWKYISNNIEDEYDGFLMNRRHEFITAPYSWDYDEEELTDYSQKCITYLLDYINRNDIDVLFTLCPYDISPKQMRRANVLSKIIEEAGGTFVNMCGDYAPYEIDYSRDFYNARHLSIFGAKKYTEYLGKYIKDNYAISDHRKEEKYEEWNEKAEKAFEKEEEIIDYLNTRIKEREENTYYNRLVSTKNNFEEWINYIFFSDDVSIFMVCKGEMFETRGMIHNFFSNVGFYDADKSNKHWISSCNVIYDEDENEVKGTIRSTEQEWKILHDGEMVSIVIDGEEYAPNEGGVNIVVWDENIGEPLDVLVITPDGNGGTMINRKNYSIPTKKYTDDIDE